MTRSKDLHLMCMYVNITNYQALQVALTLGPFTWPKWVRVEHVIASPDWSGDREISTSFDAFAFA